MSDTTDLLAGAPGGDPGSVVGAGSDAAAASESRPRRRAGLSGMLLPELQALAGNLGITGTARMRKGDLVAAIEARGGNGGPPSAPRRGADDPGPDGSPPGGSPQRPDTPREQDTLPLSGAAPTPSDASADAPLGWVGAAAPAEDTLSRPVRGEGRTRRGASRPAGPPTDSAADPERPSSADGPAARLDTRPNGRPDAGSEDGRRPSGRWDGDRPGADGAGPRANGDQNGGRSRERVRDRGDRTDGARNERDRTDGARNERDRTDGARNDRQDRAAQGESGPGGQNDRDDDLDGGGRRRGRRFRDRRRGGSGSGSGGTGGGRERFGGDGPEPVVADDDVLIPVAGILDLLDNYAFVRTSGYLTGPNDVYVSLAQVRRYGLRRGDAVTGAVRQPRDGERRDKYNALVRLDTVNGVDPEQARDRPEFMKLVPLYPQDRLRLETEPHLLTTRVIDLVMPLGKGQRALIVSPPKAGKTMVLQAIANAIATNNPECHLMVVLVDERPEEVTDMQRSVKGEVIASTFDRPPSDHTTVAELSIERAKRLVELGHDVVVLLDSITRLGRAYNLAAPASGRILSGGVDSTALYPPKRFLGAARNIEDGGSLTILATALVETGSTMDTVIFEEFKGTGNAELKLDRKIADRRVFPAIDIDPSSTRKEEILLPPDELAIVHKLRRVLHALDSQQALELMLSRLKETRTNAEFLMQVQKNTPGQD